MHLSFVQTILDSVVEEDLSSSYIQKTLANSKYLWSYVIAGKAWQKLVMYKQPYP